MRPHATALASTAVAIAIAGVLAPAPARAQQPSCREDPRHSAPCTTERRARGTGEAVTGAVLFSLGYTLPVIAGAAGMYSCGQGRSFQCPLILSFLPIVGMPAGVAWSAAVEPPPPAGTYNDGFTYLFMGALIASAVQIVGASLFIHGMVRERRARVNGERTGRRSFALLPGPTAIGFSIAFAE